MSKARPTHGGSTLEGWTELGAKRAQLLGRLERLRVRPSAELDEDGNAVPVPRHHPDVPRTDSDAVGSQWVRDRSGLQGSALRIGPT